MKIGLKKCVMIGVAALLMGFSAPHRQNAPDAVQPVDEVNPYLGNRPTTLGVLNDFPEFHVDTTLVN